MKGGGGHTDSGLPMILATTLVASLRISEAITESTGILVNKFKVGIFWITKPPFFAFDPFPGAKLKLFQ